MTVIDTYGKMTRPPKHEGLDRYECRKALLKDLEEGGYLVKTEPFKLPGRCHRCDTSVEPSYPNSGLSEWSPCRAGTRRFGRAGEVRARALAKITRIGWKTSATGAFQGSQWANRIPAWYCDECCKTIVAREEPDLVLIAAGHCVKTRTCWTRGSPPPSGRSRLRGLKRQPT